MRIHRAWALFVAWLPAAPSRAASPCSPPGELLGRASGYVSSLEQGLSIVVGEEQYKQHLFRGRGSPAQSRRLESEVAWVPTGDAMVWAFYRDVRSVDGEPVRDRSARLDALFPAGATASARAQAEQILEEGARYNLGRRRTVNSPTLALGLLHPRNQRRLAFRLAGSEEKHGVTVCRLRFEEEVRPTLIRTPRGEDLPARGLVWIEPRPASSSRAAWRRARAGSSPS